MTQYNCSIAADGSSEKIEGCNEPIQWAWGLGDADAK